jgi:hypothetical protein
MGRLQFKMIGLEQINFAVQNSNESMIIVALVSCVGIMHPKAETSKDCQRGKYINISNHAD